jgi:hypothetical protein
MFLEGRDHANPIFSTNNRLLAALSPSDASLLEPHLERVELDFRYSLEMSQKPISHVYFPKRASAPRWRSLEEGTGSRSASSVATGCRGWRW